MYKTHLPLQSLTVGIFTDNHPEKKIDSNCLINNCQSLLVIIDAHCRYILSLERPSSDKTNFLLVNITTLYKNLQKKLVYSKKSSNFAAQTCAGDVCTSSAGVADIFKRRLLTLCSDVLKLRNFHFSIRTQQRQMSYGIQIIPLVPIWYMFCVYMCTHARTLTMWHKSIVLYSAWASALSFYQKGNARAS